jgi:hypothetical protein
MIRIASAGQAKPWTVTKRSRALVHGNWRCNVNEIKIKISDDTLKALHKCISINKMCGRLMPEMDEMHALAVFVAGGLERGYDEIEVFTVVPKNSEGSH